MLARRNLFLALIAAFALLAALPASAAEWKPFDAAAFAQAQKDGKPILVGLSSTYLYQTAREYGPFDDYDDVRGEPQGHFVVLCGYDKAEKHVRVADPLLPNPMTGDSQYYNVSMDRLIAAIMLGIVTYDANLLVIEPKPQPASV